MNEQKWIQGSELGVKAACLALACTASLAGAAPTNTVPTQWHFEGITPGTAIVDTNSVGNYGFEGTPFTTSNNAAEVVATVPTEPPNGYPLPNETHANVMQILGEVEAGFETNQTAGAQNMYINAMVQAGRLNFEPDSPQGAQVAAYFNSNGLLVVRHALYTNGFSAALNRQWTELSHTPVDSNDWVRLTIVMDYLGAGPGFSPQEHYYSVFLNGTALTSEKAYRSSVLDSADGDYPVTAGPDETNRWFLCADSGFGNGPLEPANQPNNAFFSAVAFDGAGNVDDLVVSATADTNAPPQSPYDIWISGFPVGDDNPGVDDDEDGASNFEEYVAGTDPSSALSTFKITREQYTGTSNLVVWIGGTNSGNFTAYTMYRSTNLLSGDGWVPVATDLPRAPSGTNVWYDTAPPAPHAYYLPSLPTNAP